MRRTIITLLGCFAALFALAIPAGASVTPSHTHGYPVATNGRPAVDPIELWTNDGHSPTFELHAHAGGDQLSVSSVVQDWTLVNANTWRGTTVWEIQLEGGGCAQYTANGNGIYDNSCVNRDSKEWWDFAPNGQGTGLYCLINAYAYDNTGFFAMSAGSNSDGSLVSGKAEINGCITATQEWADLSS